MRGNDLAGFIVADPFLLGEENMELLTKESLFLGNLVGGDFDVYLKRSWYKMG